MALSQLGDQRRRQWKSQPNAGNLCASLDHRLTSVVDGTLETQISSDVSAYI